MENSSTPKPYDGKENYIFISYSHKDADTVMPIIKRLQSDGFRVWYDDGISLGTEWPEVIAQHLNDCALFIAFLSETYIDSFNCKREVDFAVRKRKQFLAVFLEETELSLGLEMQISSVQCVEYYKTTQEQFWDKFYTSEVVKESGCREEGSAESGINTQIIASENPNANEKPEVNTQIIPNAQTIPNAQAVPNTQAVPNAQAPASSRPAVNISGPVSAKNTEITEEFTASTINQHIPAKKNPFKSMLPVIIGVIALIFIIGISLGITIFRLNSAPKQSTKADKRTIAFENVKIKDRDLKKAAKGKEIRAIILENCELSIKDKETWNDIMNDKISKIIITNCGFTDEDAFVLLSNASALTELDLSDNQLTTISFANNPKLNKVTLRRNQITNIDKTNLENLGYCYLDDNLLTSLEGLETAIHLRNLSANNNQINNLDALKNCTRLVELSLAGNNIENVSVLQGSKESLQKLNLSQNKVKNVAEIFPMPELKNLSLDDNMIDTLYLEGTEKLSYLSARNNQIDSLTGRFEKMTYMDLANNKLSGEIDLSKCSKLRNAFLENNYISSVILYTDTLNYGNISIFNNPVAKINKADKKLSYDIYMSYHDDLKDYLGERFSSKLYLADCPLNLRVSYEEVWGKFSVEFCDSGEMTEKVEPLRKEFQ